MLINYQKIAMGAHTNVQMVPIELRDQQKNYMR
jgi:hypothetical protein